MSNFFSQVRIISFFLFLIIISNQKVLAIKDSCDCDVILNELIGKVERNYAGFADKVNLKNQLEYNNLKQILLKRSEKCEQEDTCKAILINYMNFFHDHHLFLRTNNSISKSSQPQAHKNEDLFLPKVKIIDSSTIIITLPNFYAKYSQAIADTIEKYKKQILRTEYLILDLSRNAGGATFAYEPLLPFIYTKPIKHYGKKTLATRENIDVYKDDIERDKASMSKDQYNDYQDFINRMEKNVNNWVDHDNEEETEYTKSEFPKRVSIIIDKECGSSGELFVLEALQSDKVMIFGQNTSGTVDYGNSMQHSLSCEKLLVKIPMVRNNWIDELEPIDKEGIKPMVYIARENNNWIEFILNYLKKN